MDDNAPDRLNPRAFYINGPKLADLLEGLLAPPRPTWLDKASETLMAERSQEDLDKMISVVTEAAERGDTTPPPAVLVWAQRECEATVAAMLDAIRADFAQAPDLTDDPTDQAMQAGLALWDGLPPRGDKRTTAIKLAFSVLGHLLLPLAESETLVERTAVNLADRADELDEKYAAGETALTGDAWMNWMCGYNGPGVDAFAH